MKRGFEDLEYYIAFSKLVQKFNKDIHKRELKRQKWPWFLLV